MSRWTCAPSLHYRWFLLVRLGCRGNQISAHNPKAAGSNPAPATTEIALHTLTPNNTSAVISDSSSETTLCQNRTRDWKSCVHPSPSGERTGGSRSGIYGQIPHGLPIALRGPCLRARHEYAPGPDRWESGSPAFFSAGRAGSTGPRQGGNPLDTKV